MKSRAESPSLDDQEALPFYECLSKATCGPNDKGVCVWSMSPAVTDCLLSAKPPSNRTPHRDFHVHWDTLEGAPPAVYSPYESLAHIDSLGLTTGYLVTNTYLAHRAPELSVDDLVGINRTYSDILGTHPNRNKYRMLCGVSFQRADAPKLAAQCLAIPRVRGIKLRDFTVDTPAALEKFETVVKQANAPGALILSHFGSYEHFGPPPSDLRERATEDTSKIVRVMDANRNATLIIAHSGFGSFIDAKALGEIGDHYRDNPNLPRNIYLEISDALVSSESGHVRSSASDAIESLRRFGLEWVLYGSDYIEGPTDVGLLNTLSMVGLSKEELQTIMLDNGAKLEAQHSQLRFAP